jgi:hypothetical protein
MGPRQIKRHCQLTDESQELIRVAMTELNLSARAYDRILKVSRTVADLAASDNITPGTSAKPSNTEPSTGCFGSRPRTKWRLGEQRRGLSLVRARRWSCRRSSELATHRLEL